MDEYFHCIDRCEWIIFDVVFLLYKIHEIISICDTIINNLKENLETTDKTDEIISSLSDVFLYLFYVNSMLIIPNIIKNS